MIETAVIKVECEPFGWLKDISNPQPTDRARCTTVLAHLRAGKPPCTGLTKWRVTRRVRRGLTSTAYYCDDHYPDEYVEHIEHNDIGDDEITA